MSHTSLSLVVCCLVPKGTRMEQVAMDAILAAARVKQPANQLAVQPTAGGHRRQLEA